MLVVLQLGVVMPRDIHLASDDRLDLVLFSLFVLMLVGELEELLDTVHVSVVGDGQRGHAHGFCPVEQSGYRRESVEDGILGVDVEVYECHSGIIFHTNIPKMTYRSKLGMTKSY